MKPKYIIIHSHAIEIKHDGKLYTPMEWLRFLGLHCHSFHYPDGSIENWIDKDKVAYHAGISEWKDDKYLNNCSIGKEILIPNCYDWDTFKVAINNPKSFTDEMYQSLAKDCASDCKEFLLNPETDILLHNWVSGKHVRPNKPKIDPGNGFDYIRLINMTNSEIIKL